MPDFEVRFMKTVCNDTGYESSVCQGQVSVGANDPTEALRTAVAKFTRQHEIPDWAIHADTIEIRNARRPARSAAA